MRLLKLHPFRVLAILALSLALASYLFKQSPAPIAMPTTPDTRKQPGDELLVRIFDHARDGQTEAVQLYLDSGYTPNIVSARGDSLLIVAAYHGHTDLIKLLLAQPGGVQVDFQNSMGFTALTGASFKGYTDIMTQLIAAGATVNHRNLSGQTALMFAALSGRLDAVKLLLSHGADAKAKDTTGKDAAGLATQQGATEVTAVLSAHP